MLTELAAELKNDEEEALRCHTNFIMAFATQLSTILKTGCYKMSVCLHTRRKIDQDKFKTTLSQYHFS